MAFRHFSRQAVRCLVAIGLVVSSGLSWPARAQVTARANADPYLETQSVRAIDENSVDMASGNLIHQRVDISIGAKERTLSLDSGVSAQHGNNWDMSISVEPFTVIVSGGTVNKKFDVIRDPVDFRRTYYKNINNTAETLEEEDFGAVLVFISAEGVRYRFSAYNGEGGLEYHISSIVYPDGYNISVAQLPLKFCGREWQDLNGNGIDEEWEYRNSPCYQKVRIQSVSDNLGRRIKFTYAADFEHNYSTEHQDYEAYEWLRRTGAVSSNFYLDPCDAIADRCVYNFPWPKVSYELKGELVGEMVGAIPGFDVTLADGSKFQYRPGYGSNGEQYLYIKRPGATDYDYLVKSYNTNFSDPSLPTEFDIVNGGVRVKYRLQNVPLFFTGSSIRGIVSRLSPSGATKRVETEKYERSLPATCVYGPYGGCKTRVVDENIVRSVAGDLGETRSVYDRELARKMETVLPDGRREIYSYDARGNITATTIKAVPGSGLNDIVTTSGYDTVCASRAACNKPSWVRDARGAQTDFSYDQATGQVLTITKPAPGQGQPRPQTRYSYTVVNGISLVKEIRP